MSWSRSAGLALLSLTVPPTTEVSGDAPLPPGVSTLSTTVTPMWTKKHAEVHAIRVRLNGIGVRTHANWVLFRLPFDTTERDRLRKVTFSARAASPTDVGALRIGSVCVTIPSSGGVDQWTLYTAGGIGWTDRFRVHRLAPTHDPTILGINVPTRVANHVACGRDDGHLRNPDEWTLSIDWEER